MSTTAPAEADLVCSVRVVRDSRGLASDLLIASVEVRSANQGHLAALVGRRMAEVLPDVADELIRRIAAAEGASADLSGAPLPAPVRSLRADPSGQADTWRLSLASAPDVPSGDARVRELNHRVLNSLAMLSSIIGFESRALEDEAGRAALERVRSRLVAVSNLYRILSGPSPGSAIRADVYLRSVADGVAASVGFGQRITIEVEAEPCELTTSQAASLGLITNEAMVNAYKHAFDGRRAGRIRIGLTRTADDLLLTVTDDGAGFSGQARRGLGTTLVETLAEDLSGETSVESGDRGTSVRVRFPAAR